MNGVRTADRESGLNDQLSKVPLNAPLPAAKLVVSCRVIRRRRLSMSVFGSAVFMAAAISATMSAYWVPMPIARRLSFSSGSGEPFSSRGLHWPLLQPGAALTFWPSKVHFSGASRATCRRRRSLNASGRRSHASW